ncbi:S8 family serine peptidase [Mariniflexile ostreae]|uniref:S8 family serine peptidase n=1 Tax=Mariniflexile ostreae TaxID=1520892 RepID=A0ABV5FC19_9FLAO
MKNKILVFFIVFHTMGFAQLDDAWLYFTDKDKVATSIENPISILSEKAIQRKKRHRILIDVRDVPVNQNYIDQIKKITGISVMAKSKWFNAVHVRGRQSDIQALSSLSFVNRIAFAARNTTASKNAQIRDKDKVKLENTQTVLDYGDAFNQIKMFNGDALHLLNYTGSGMTVAIMDAGFSNVDSMSSFERSRTAKNIIGTYDFVDRKVGVYTKSNHGTHVLSHMAGYIPGEFVGTAPDAAYYLFITEDTTIENPVEESYWVEAAERADSLGVDVINTSLGYTLYDDTRYSYTPENMDGNTAFITKGANIAFEKGMLLVNAAGNEGNNSWGIVAAPADAAGVFTVGAVDAKGNLANFSSRGSASQATWKPDVVAQGQASYLINGDDTIRTGNGTSYSAPIMAGGLVCLWQAMPNKTNVEIMQLVRESASQFGSPDFNLGYGIPDLQAVVSKVLYTEIIEKENDNLKLFPNPTSSQLYFSLTTNIDSHRLKLYDVFGREVLNIIMSLENNPIDLTFLSPGMYLARVESKTKSKTIKILKN